MDVGRARGLLKTLANDPSAHAVPRTHARPARPSERLEGVQREALLRLHAG